MLSEGSYTRMFFDMFHIQPPSQGAWVFKMSMKCKCKIKRLTLTCPWLLNSKSGDKCLKYPQKFCQFFFLSLHTSYFGTDNTIALKNK